MTENNLPHPYFAFLTIILLGLLNMASVRASDFHSDSLLIQKNISNEKLQKNINWEKLFNLNNRLAELVAYKGLSAKVLDMVQKTKNEIKKRGLTNNYGYAKALEIEGDVSFYIGDYDRARLCWQRAVDICKRLFGETSPYYAEAQCYLARILAKEGQHKKAYDITQRAIAIIEKGPASDINTPLCYVAAANAAKLYGKDVFGTTIAYKEAENLLNKAVGFLAHNRNFSHMTALVYHNIGNINTDKVQPLFRLNAKLHYQRAKAFYTKAINANNQYFGNSGRNSVTYMTKAILEQYYVGKGNMNLCLENANKSIICLVSSFHPLTASETPIFDKNILEKEVIIANLRYKADAYMNLYKSTGQAKYLDFAFAQLLAMEQWYLALVNTYQSKNASIITNKYGLSPYNELFELAARKYSKNGDIKSLSQAFKYTELAKFETVLRSNSNIGFNNLTITIEEAQKKLNSNDLLLEYHNGPAYGGVFIITKNSAEFRQISDITNTIEYSKKIQVAIFNNDIQGLKYNSALIYNSAFSGLQKEMQAAKKIVLVPLNMCVNLPFDAIITDTTGVKTFDNAIGKYFIQKYNYTTSLSSTLYFTNNKSYNGFKIAVAENKQQPALYFSQVLAQKNAADFGAEVVNNQDASINYIKNLNLSCNIFHLAAHAEADSLNYYGGKIYMADGLASADDLRDMRINSNLIVLSACETSKGVASYEGIIGLLHTFYSAGANSVVSTTFKTDEKATNEILGDFYTYLAEGKTKGEAIRLAKIKYINTHAGENRKPYYWSGLIYLGNYEGIVLEQKNSTLKFWIVGLFFFAGFIYWLIKRMKSSSFFNRSSSSL